MAKKEKLFKAKKTEELTLSDNDLPSKNTTSYWVVVGQENDLNRPEKFKKDNRIFKNPEGLSWPIIEKNTGKWLIFLDISDLDFTWQKVKKATQEGILGIGAKAATAKENSNASSKNEKVICVYTYNWHDKDDVFRIEKMLRSIGITQTLFYKADSDTSEGNYKNKGNKNISKYISKGAKSYKEIALAKLNGVGYMKCKDLNNIGIITFDDLLAFDTSKKLVGTGITSGYINKLKLQALSQIENKIFKLSAFQFPESEMLHFDIETDIYKPHVEMRVWSIAIHHNKKVKHFYAPTWNDEKKILKEFLKYLKDCKNTSLFSYSSFDVSVLKFALARHKLDVDFFINCNHFDLCAILKQNYILPLESYSVKEVGRFLGYNYKSPFYGGLMAAMEYIQNQNTGNKISKKLLNYIQDDVKVMHHIIEKIKSRKDIKDIFDHKEDVGQFAELSHTPSISYSKTGIIQPTSQYIINENDFKCPFCESKNFFKNGMAKKKFRYKCKNCDKGFTSIINSKAICRTNENTETE